MKLTAELKERIDRYFEQIAADELYTILTTQYHLQEIDDDKSDATAIPKTEYYSVVKNDDTPILSRDKETSIVVNEIMSYGNLNVEQNFGEVQAQFLSSTSNIQEDIVCDDLDSIPLAA